MIGNQLTALKHTRLGATKTNSISLNQTEQRLISQPFLLLFMPNITQGRFIITQTLTKTLISKIKNATVGTDHIPIFTTKTKLLRLGHLHSL